MLLQPGSRPVPNYPDYRLMRKLGAGAFGEVWHAHGPGGLDVALKFIRLDPHGLAVELRSLEAIKGVRHPNLVSLFGAWHTGHWLILAMEVCDRSLQDRLAEALGQGLPGIPLAELLTYMSDAANGLDALNAKQVQHRDVKPANLLLLNSGVKVADFGLAKVLERTVASNSGAGTIAYTAPECFKGKLTQQSDQYSLAVTYCHLRNGRLLFDGNQAQLMYAHLELEPDLSLLPRAERTTLARALSKEPGKRWRSCTVFVDELNKAYERAKEEERERQEAERRRQEQDRQNREAEVARSNADADAKRAQVERQTLASRLSILAQMEQRWRKAIDQAAEESRPGIEREAAANIKEWRHSLGLGGSDHDSQPCLQSEYEKARDSLLGLGGSEHGFQQEPAQQKRIAPFNVPRPTFNWFIVTPICFAISFLTIFMIWRSSNYSGPGEGAWAPGYRSSGPGMGRVVSPKEAEEQRKAYQEKPISEKLTYAGLAWVVWDAGLLFMAFVWHRTRLQKWGENQASRVAATLAKPRQP